MVKNGFSGADDEHKQLTIGSLQTSFPIIIIIIFIALGSKDPEG